MPETQRRRTGSPATPEPPIPPASEGWIPSYSYAISATDPDGPQNDLRYSLVSDAQGVVINESTGILRWVTGETDGGTTANVTVTFSDQGTPVRSTAVSFFKNVMPNENGFIIVEDDPILPIRFYRQPEP